MAYYKSIFSIITSLTFLYSSATPSRAIVDDYSTGELNNRSFTEAENLQSTNQINYPVSLTKSSFPLYIAQDTDSEANKSQNNNQKESKSSDSKVPKAIRVILKALGGRKALFILSITSVLVTGTAVFILLKLFDDHQPKDLDPEDLQSQDQIPKTTSTDLNLKANDSEQSPSKWPRFPETSYLANKNNSLDSFVPPLQKSGENTSVEISKHSLKSHNLDIKAENFSTIESEENNHYERPENKVNLSQANNQHSTVEDSRDITLPNNYPLPEVNVVEELISGLQNFDPKKRHHAIWELGQRGDSRAVQPLVNLLIDSDSKQQSLILATLSEIGTKTLKPMNRALAMSMQNDNAEVRKNAIRDLTRIYELIIQTTSLLQQAEYDPDPEVEKTAKWALEQLNRIRPR
ncbi:MULTISPECIES: HEAT repeat domain-containing protein [Okeania]|uniref:HEAT repeat domain-containing protein n=1 Tax=Okeania TaxID=1458928 RepID=UPI000F53B211|nr:MULTISPECIES: HEAT repeat domain-containing protein [Okeania]NET17584.1 HEAT repeat domain-containing protein [Okeania sp. SIO1H6]NES74762.1 HEAT repeat domain-containing protein [Okeania sp. SIO1H4]NET18485.1 HEAT repeat domain-containing protein [Okeania sp. SIO1H5]NET80370.1 HEAT repeat domain-containing protein [Okeania sp. SIO1F9]NET93136.1 HEAT repeat domain-containing protein [Okeania sp. SIO1H2]